MKFEEKEGTLINPSKHVLDYTMYQIHIHKKEWIKFQCTILSFHLHLDQIYYLPSIKGAIIFQPPSYANESTQ